MVSILKEVRKRLSLAPDSQMPPPVMSAIEGTYDFFQQQWAGSKYQQYQSIFDNDPEVQGVIMSYGFMVFRSYNGVDCEVKGLEGEGKENVKRACADFESRLNLQQKFMVDAMELMTHGDRIYHQVIEDDKLVDLEPWPLQFTTILDVEPQKGEMPTVSTTHLIEEANYYVFNEQAIGLDISGFVSMPKEVMFHLSLSREATLVQDIRNRWTLGIWSRSPLNPLILPVRWKMNSIYSDILWRNRNVPREHHQLDLSAFDPSLYPGDATAKIEASRTAAQTAIDTYAKGLKTQKADQGYVTGKETVIGYIEPKSTTYSAPNDLISQINRSIGHALGMDIETPRTFAGLVQSGSFMLMRGQALVGIIKMGYERLLREDLKRQFPMLSPEVLNQIKIKVKIILEKDKSELARQIAVLKETKHFTPTEIRAEWGYDPLTEEQKAEIQEFEMANKPKTPAERHTQSTQELVADMVDRRLPKEVRPIRYPSEKERTQKT